MKSLLPIILLCVLLSACVKEINYSTEGFKKEIVIEANLNDLDSFSFVTISKMNFLNRDTAKDYVSKASIQLTDLDTKKATSYSEYSPGKYKSSYFVGQPGHDYEMKVLIESVTYTAKCYLPLPVKLDTVEFQDMTIFGGKGYHPLLNFQDGKGINNFYYFKQSINGIIDRQYYVYNDHFMDGKYQNLELYKNDFINLGDKVRVEMYCIDEPIYNYFSQLKNQDVTSGQPVIAPANPPSNFSGGVLGYFSAHSLQVKDLIVR